MAFSRRAPQRSAARPGPPTTARGARDPAHPPLPRRAAPAPQFISGTTHNGLA
jgi:hypothetical protein